MSVSCILSNIACSPEVSCQYKCQYEYDNEPWRERTTVLQDGGDTLSAGEDTCALPWLLSYHLFKLAKLMYHHLCPAMLKDAWAAHLWQCSWAVLNTCVIVIPKVPQSSFILSVQRFLAFLFTLSRALLQAVLSSGICHHSFS